MEFLASLKEIKSQLSEYNEKIGENIWSSDLTEKEKGEKLDDEFERCNEYNETIIFCSIKLEECINQFTGVAVGSGLGPSVEQKLRLKPRTTPLPIFNGNPNEILEKFIGYSKHCLF